MDREKKCPRCGSTDNWKSGWNFLSGKKVQMHQCKKCGHKFRGKTEISLEY